MTEFKKRTRKCPECGGTIFIEDKNRGELICASCGLVLEEGSIDRGQEWRSFDSEQASQRARTGAPLTFTKHDKGMMTEIGKGLGELYKVPGKKRAQYYRLKKWHKRLIESKDRNLSFALSELQRIISFLNLPKSVHEKVGRYYEEAVDKGLVRGRSIESVIAALVYGVARQFRTPRTLDEISNASEVERKEIGRTYRFLARELALKLMPTSPQDYVERFCSELRLSEDTKTKALEILPNNPFNPFFSHVYCFC